MAKYRKKLVVIEAFRFNGVNWQECLQFMSEIPLAFTDELSVRDKLEIHTEEGVMRASVGDYIIKGVKGEFYPCKPDIFEETYEEVEE